jgi:hypothetical protein
VWPVSSRGDAFARGFSVFAILAVGTPYKVVQGQMPLQKKQEPGSSAATKDIGSSAFGTIVRSAAAEEFAAPAGAVASTAKTNATVASDHPGISSCKPHYWGPFGLGSLLNNSLEICDTGHDLKESSRVHIRSCWDTGFRRYRYVEMDYEWEGKPYVGWAITGKAPNYWSWIVPDQNFLKAPPPSCSTATRDS